MRATDRLQAASRALALLLAAACALAAVHGASSDSSAASSADVGDCNIGDWLANPLLVQCGVDGRYNFSSGVTPTVAQAARMCGSSSCTTLFQAASLSTGVSECRLPFGDHILLLADLVNYVLGICYTSGSASVGGSTSSTSSSAGIGGATDTAASSSAATDASASSDDGGSTSVVVGVVVGVVVLLALVAGFWWRRRRQQKRALTDDSSDPSNRRAYTPMLSVTARNDPLAPRPANTPSTSSTTGSGGSLAAFRIGKKPHARLSDLSPWRVNVDDIQDLNRIGHGAHGVVWRVMYRGSTVLASKRIQVDQISHKHTQDFIDEITLVSSLQHPNIVAFVGAAWTMESDLQVLLEFMNEGDLRGYLLRPETPRAWTLQKLSIAHDILQALVYVHSLQPPLVHRDLKSQNVMLTAAGDEAIQQGLAIQTALTAKLTDFGVSRFHSENNTMTVGVGTSRWLAPEVILGKTNYGPPADMYSFGVVLSELDTHELPYDDARSSAGESLANVAILQRVAMGQLKPTFNTKTCIPEVLVLARQCLEHDPSKRLTAAQAVTKLLELMEAMAEEETTQQRIV